MGTPGSAVEQSPEEIHRLLTAAAVQHRPIVALYDGTRRLLCPHVVGYNQSGEWRCSVINTGEKPRAGHCRVAVRGTGAAFR